jgi:hypothetical protein
MADWLESTDPTAPPQPVESEDLGKPGATP